MLAQHTLSAEAMLAAEQVYSITSIAEHPPNNYIEFDEVRIMPRRLQFSDATADRVYKQAIMIINCSTHSVHVRIEPPSNTDILKIKAIQRSERLSPGFTLKRDVEYRYHPHTAKAYYHIPIYINDKRILYKITIIPSTALVLVDPTSIDFGLMDMSLSVTRRSFKIRNIGTKPTRFTIDLGSNELQICVDPPKGVVKPNGEVSVAVELMVSEEGKFRTKFYVKATSVFEVNVFGKVIMGKLEVINIPSCSTFAMVDFPRTFYGSKSVQQIVVRNSCASRAVFCILFEGLKENIFMTYNNAIKQKPELKRFSVSPMDGRLEARESRIITVSYEPLLYSSDHKQHIYDLSVIQIKKLSNCKDLNVADYPDGLYSALSDFADDRLDIKTRNMSFSGSQATSIGTLSQGSDPLSMRSYQEYLEVDPLSDLSSTFDVCLHGEPEAINVKIIPDAILIKDMDLNKYQDRTIQIFNGSYNLPLTFSYVKGAGIDVKPKSGVLKCNSSRELLISFVATKLGQINTQAKFNFYCYNYPFEKEESEKRLIGSVNLNVKLNAKTTTKYPIPPRTSGIVPISNFKDAKYVDINSAKVRAKSVPECKYQMVPFMSHALSFDEYHFRREQKSLKSLSNEFYQKFLKQNRLQQMKLLRDNLIAEKEKSFLKLFLIYSAFVELADDAPSASTRVFDGFLPLSPTQLHKITIDPIHIVVGRTAAYSRLELSFSIINRNRSTIRAFLVPEKQRFSFPKGDAVFIPGKSTKVVDFSFFAESEGYYSLGIRILINECHVFEVTLSVPVVNRVLHFSTNSIKFEENDSSYKYFELYNPLNVPIDYAWDCSQSNFEVHPTSARIESKSRIICMVEHNPLLNKSSCKSIVLSSALRNMTKIYAKAAPQTPTIHITSKFIDFHHVGLNLRENRNTLLWNTGRNKIKFEIENPFKRNGLKVSPFVGFIAGRSCQLINLSYCSLDCGKFDFKLKLTINDFHDQGFIHLVGEVVFPQLTFKPAEFRVRMPVTAYECKTITVENQTDARTHLDISGTYSVSDDIDSEAVANPSLQITPRGTVSFVLHLVSQDVTNYNFFCPIQINHILGPPTSSNSLCVKTATYISDAVNLHCPSTIPHQKCALYFFTSTFSVSKQRMHFYYTPYSRQLNSTIDATTFKNISSELVQICIRTDNLSENFSMSITGTCEVIERTYSITCALPPGDEITFNFEFLAIAPGTFKCHLPFYVRNFYKNEVHNKLVISAEYAIPELIVPAVVYFDLVPLQQTCERSFTLMTNNHSSTCEIRWCSDSFDIQVALNSSTNLDEEQVIEVKLVYMPYCSGPLNSIVTFQCDCDSTAVVHCIGGADNSIFTNYRSFVLLENRSYSQHTTSDILRPDSSQYVMPNVNYPFFPDMPDASHKFFSKTLEILEEWLYSQGFFGKYRFRIPDSISRIIELPPCVVVAPKDHRVKPGQSSMTIRKVLIIPYIELLKNLTTSEIVADFIRPIPENHFERVKFLHNIYKDILSFLEDVVGAILPHVKAEYLIPYEYYVDYIMHVVNDIGTLHSTIEYYSNEKFRLLSIQCWMDLLLQTIKVFVMQRYDSGVEDSFNLDTPTASQPSENKSEIHFSRSRSLGEELSTFLVPRMTEMPQSCHLYSFKELRLLEWLNDHLETHKDQLCDGTAKDEQRIIDNFDSAVRDGTAFAAVTIAYCPYLKHYLNDMYWQPSSLAEYHHNAASLLQAWAAVYSTFNVLPADIYEPHPVLMALLTYYLYMFLPTLRASSEIDASANLSSSSTFKVSITNTNDFIVYYRILFFGDERVSFSTVRDAFFIKPRSVEMVCVRYSAKFMKRVSAVMVFCGETVGSRSARSCAYTLIGTPDITYVTSQFSFKVREYTQQERAIDIQAPYRTAASYDLFFSLDQPTSLSTLVLFSYENIVKDRLPCKIFYDGSQIFFNEQGRASITLSLISLAMDCRTVWFYLKNQHIGDFCVKFHVSSLPTLDIRLLTLQVPEEVYVAQCVCKERGIKFCKKNVYLKVPKYNDQYLQSFMTVFLSLKESHADFWGEYINKISAMRHMKRNLVGNWNPDMYNNVRMLSEDRKYSVTLSNCEDEQLTYDNELLLQDFVKRDRGTFINLRIHMGDVKVVGFRLTLECEELHEVRLYDVAVANVRTVKSDMFER